MRWCPGCGDYAVLKAVQRTMPELGAARENTVFISGIGCSSAASLIIWRRYGFHTIHGRAPAVATGVKLANPELDVWIITGDGDALSIGGNHTMHLLRRNLDCQVLLFNNEIYGLTKGQYSPTSRGSARGQPSTPFGSVDRPADAVRLRARLGRALRRPRHRRAQESARRCSRPPMPTRAPSFVEIYQNCVVYNDDVFAPFTDKGVAAEKQLWARAGREDAVRGRHQGPALDIGTGYMLKVVDGDGRRRSVHRPRSRPTAPSPICWSRCRSASVPGGAGRDLR